MNGGTSCRGVEVTPRLVHTHPQWVGLARFLSEEPTPSAPSAFTVFQGYLHRHAHSDLDGGGSGLRRSPQWDTQTNWYRTKNDETSHLMIGSTSHSEQARAFPFARLFLALA
jgi:hypothetical protein